MRNKKRKIISGPNPKRGKGKKKIWSYKCEKSEIGRSRKAEHRKRERRKHSERKEKEGRKREEKRREKIGIFDPMHKGNNSNQLV